MHDLIKCDGKFYGMQVSMTQQSGDFLKLIFTIITHNNPIGRLGLWTSS